MMTGFNTRMLAVVAAFYAQGSEARPKVPSPMTWMRDKADPKLDSALKQFIGPYKQENPTDEKEVEQMFVKGENNTVILPGGDIIISDYISVSDWMYTEMAE